MQPDNVHRPLRCSGLIFSMPVKKNPADTVGGVIFFALLPILGPICPDFALWVKRSSGKGGESVQQISKTQARAFAGVYLRTMDPQRAAAAIGYADGLRALGNEEVGRQIRRGRELLAREFTPEDTVRRMAELAFGRANDCVRLALEPDADVDSLDLSLLQEVKRNDKGTIEIRLVDRLRVLERLLALERSGEDETNAFFRAMCESLEDDDREESD